MEQGRARLWLGQGPRRQQHGSMDGLLDGEGGLNEDSSVAPTGWQEQDGEEFAGGRWVWEGVGAY
jgi:hypothetical protein